MFIEGRLSVKAVLKAGKRACGPLYLAEDIRKDHDLGYLLKLARSRQLEIHTVTREQLDAMTQSHTHGGVVLSAGQRRMDELGHLAGTIVLLEGITDPYQIGDIIRTIRLAGVRTLISDAYQFGDSEAVILRASGGLSEQIRWISGPLDGLLDRLKMDDYTIYGAQRTDNSQPLQTVHFAKRRVLCVGGRLRGFSRAVSDRLDEAVVLPSDEQVHLAYSAVGACSIFVYHAQYLDLMEGK